jgi:hypothetical protein
LFQKIGAFFNISTTWLTIGSVVTVLVTASVIHGGYDNDAWRLGLLAGGLGFLISLTLNVVWYGALKGAGLTLLQVLATAGVVLVWLFRAIRQPGPSYPNQSASRSYRPYVGPESGGVTLPGLGAGQNTHDN